MSEKEKNFHNFALQSSLFKGHSDWYYCFLKAERIAHVVTILSENAHGHSEGLKSLIDASAALPSTIVYLAAGEVELRQVLAEIFSLVVSVRLLTITNVISKDTAHILVTEYEAVAQKIDAAARLSPFVTSEDFLIQSENTPTQRPALSSELSTRSLESTKIIKDINKGHIIDGHSSKPQARQNIILNFVQSHKGVSIKDITAVVTNCSEKTIQRELTDLIQRGLIRRVGERRWSLYEPVERI